MKALSTSMMTYQVDWDSLPLHDQTHNQYILGNELTTRLPVSQKILLISFKPDSWLKPPKCLMMEMKEQLESIQNPFMHPNGDISR